MTKAFIRTLATAGFAAMLSGCAGTYVPSGPAEPTASVTVKNLSSRYAAEILMHKEPETCGGMTFIRTGQGKTIDQNSVLQNAEFTFLVAADKLFGIYAGSSRPDPSNFNRFFGCDRVATFLPRNGARYLVEFSYDPPRCRMLVQEYLDGGTMAAVSARYRTQMPTSISRPGSHCSDTLESEK